MCWVVYCGGELDSKGKKKFNHLENGYCAEHMQALVAEKEIFPKINFPLSLVLAFSALLIHAMPKFKASFDSIFSSLSIHYAQWKISISLSHGKKKITFREQYFPLLIFSLLGY